MLESLDIVIDSGGSGLGFLGRPLFALLRTKEHLVADPVPWHLLHTGRQPSHFTLLSRHGLHAMWR